MSDKKADKSRFWLTYLLNDLPVGATFKPSTLHLTIIPWFVTEWEEGQVIESFNKTFSGLPTLELRVGKLDEFMHKRRILINHVEAPSQLLDLHSTALAWLEILEGRWAVENPHVGEEYIPHIRRRQGRNAEEGSKLTVSSLSLVKARRRGDDYRQVVAKAKFD